MMYKECEWCKEIGHKKDMIRDWCKRENIWFGWEQEWMGWFHKECHKKYKRERKVENDRDISKIV